MILRINLVQNYSSKFGKSQQQFTVTYGVCEEYTSQYSKILCDMVTTKTKATMKVMRTSVRRTTASSPRTTSSSQCTTSTPMTTLISTIAWCATCIELAHSAHCSTLDDDTAHLMAKVPSPFIVIHGHIHGAFSLIRPLPSSFTFYSSFSPSTSSTPGCSLSSTTRSSWGVVFNFIKPGEEMLRKSRSLEICGCR